MLQSCLPIPLTRRQPMLCLTIVPKYLAIKDISWHICTLCCTIRLERTVCTTSTSLIVDISLSCGGDSIVGMRCLFCLLCVLLVFSRYECIIVKMRKVHIVHREMMMEEYDGTSNPTVVYRILPQTSKCPRGIWMNFILQRAQIEWWRWCTTTCSLIFQTSRHEGFHAVCCEGITAN